MLESTVKLNNEKSIAKEHGLSVYYSLKKDYLIASLSKESTRKRSKPFPVTIEQHVRKLVFTMVQPSMWLKQKEKVIQMDLQKLDIQKD